MDLRQAACAPATECATAVAATPLHTAPHPGRPRLAEDDMPPSPSPTSPSSPSAVAPMAAMVSVGACVRRGA
jgi:hypothetical protein